MKSAGLPGLDVGMTADVTGVRLPAGPGPEPAPTGGTAPAAPRKLDMGGRLLLGTGTVMGLTPSGSEGAWLGAGGTPGDMAP